MRKSNNFIFNEIPKYKKKPIKKHKKSNHKHNYIWYKMKIKNGGGQIYSVPHKENWLRMVKSDWQIFNLCSICGKEGEIFFHFNDEKFNAILEKAIDVTPYEKIDFYKKD